MPRFPHYTSSSWWRSTGPTSPSPKLKAAMSTAYVAGLQVAELSLWSETPPGRQTSDVAEFKVEFDDEPSVVRAARLFTLVLGHVQDHVSKGRTERARCRGHRGPPAQ